MCTRQDYAGGKPKQGAAPLGFYYRLTGQLSLDFSCLEARSQRAGRFILATNILDSQALSPDQMLAEYKVRPNKSSSAAFAFLKTLFFALSDQTMKINRDITEALLSERFQIHAH